MGGKEWGPTNVFDLFGDDLTRRILVLASERPFAADELATRIDASLPTVYRRLNALLEYDLLKEQQRIDVDGNHYKTFETTLKRISLEIDDGGYDVSIQMRQSLVDQFGEFWSELGDSSTGGSTTADDGTEHPRSRRDTHHG